jgi:hypothetical protein
MANLCEVLVRFWTTLNLGGYTPKPPFNIPNREGLRVWFRSRYVPPRLFSAGAPNNWCVDHQSQ